MARNKYDIDEVMEDKFDINQLKRLFTIRANPDSRRWKQIHI